MTTCIGLDIGTSAVKGVIIGTRQQVLATAMESLTNERPRAGWSEQHPEQWWLAACRVLTTLRLASPKEFRSVQSIGLSGQMHALAALDAHDAPLRPAILWNDARATAECDALSAAMPELGNIGGVIAMPGFPAPKLLWLRRHEPENFARIRRLVLAKDYVRLKLTGEAATDMADAAGTLWLDQATRNWSPDLMAASGADPGWLPRLLEGNAVSGRLRPAVAAELGLDPNTVMAAGAGDAAAGGIGIGFVNAGDAYLSLGTSAQLFVTTDTYRPQPETLIHAFAHGLPERWCQIAAMLNGASPLSMLASVLGRTDIETLLAGAATRYRGPGRLLFLPYLAGERTPHNDANARGVLFGMDGATDASAIVQAVLEGVAYSIAESRDCLVSAGSPLSVIGAVGGGTRSAFWMQIVADVTGLTVERFQGADKGPAFGAARLALMAVTSNRPETIATKPPVLDRFEPNAGNHAGYAEGLNRFRHLYRALRPEFARGPTT